MNKKKQRATEVRLDFGKHQILSGMKVGEDGVLHFFDESGKEASPQKVEIGACFQRDKKDAKSLARVISDPQLLQTNVNRQLSRFGSIFAVDTNTQTFGSAVLSITVSIGVQNIIFDEKTWTFSVIDQDAFVFQHQSGSPEKLGWRDMIERIRNTPFVSFPVGLIVDSDLKNLNAINARKLGILEGYFLRPDFELIYGCGDRGTEELIPSAAIAECDRIGRLLFQALRRNPGQLALSECADRHISKYQRIPVENWPAEAFQRTSRIKASPSSIARL